MGTLLKNRPSKVENINILTTKSAIIKNEELQFSKEEILKISENELIKASLLGDRKVAVQLKDEFIKLYNLNLSSEKQYEVGNISKNVKNIFVGYMVSKEYPYVLLIMEDGTAECVQILNGVDIPSNNYEFNFYSQGKIQGLYDVVAFSQQSKYYFSSEDKYYYINAIREDGKVKCIELGYYNDWDDSVDDVYNMLNTSYIDEFYNSKNEEMNNVVENNSSVNKEENNSNMIGNQININNNEVGNNTGNDNGDKTESNIKEENEEQVEVKEPSVKEEENKAEVKEPSGNDEENRAEVKEPSINEENNNESNNLNENTSNNKNTSITNYDNEIVSEFERRVKESNDYFKEPLTGHYCLMKKGDTKSAYNIQDSQLFRYNVEQNNISWIASGVNDLYKDEEGNLICLLQKSYSINEEDNNILYQEYNVTDYGATNVQENESVIVETKADGSIAIQIKEGGLKKLGIYDYETALKENIKYNLYGKDQGAISIEGYMSADVDMGMLGFVGKSNKLNYIYSKPDGTVICVDIEEAIYNNSFEDIECTVTLNNSPIHSLMIGVDENIDLTTVDKSEIYYVFFYQIKENNNYKVIKFNKDYN